MADEEDEERRKKEKRQSGKSTKEQGLRGRRLTEALRAHTKGRRKERINERGGERRQGTQL